MIDVARSTSALIAGVSATVAFVVLRTVVAMGGHEPLAIDVWWHDLMVSLTSDVWVVVAWVPAVVGGTLGMIVIGAALIAWLVWRKRRWDAATLAIAMVAVVAIGATMAAVIGRTRPEDSLAESVATSFPSGHTAVATTVVVILALTFRRWHVWALGAVWVVTMMWSRTYLHAHWLSDVVAGLLEGIAVACFVWVCVDAARARRASRSAAASAGGETMESSVTT
ncbi:phosphatase PAP2 family protein [Microbacterium sp. Leaf320]|uniref:phosphatase PAP2 family protein n=1 Tax=Microbacterium sp. Leaf320 TaxID=1736334 RepID=UPI0006FD4152|nr:phosphatase PAP2 family protein [Microbacterium sp. Leaf320]KQQ66228.1 phospholipid phosphatase [Microbacterium sp. Leaf320]